MVANFGREGAQTNSIEMTSIAEDYEGKGRTASAQFSSTSAQLESLTAECTGPEVEADSLSTRMRETYMYGDRPIPALQGIHSGFDPSGANYWITGTGPTTDSPIVSDAPSMSRSPGYTDRIGRGFRLPVARSSLTRQQQGSLSENLSTQSRSSKITVNHVIDRGEGLDNSIARRPGEPDPGHQLSCESHAPLADTGKSASTPQGGSPSIPSSGSQHSRIASSSRALCMAGVRAASAVVAIASAGRETLRDDPSMHNDARMDPGEEFVIGGTGSRAAMHETEREGCAV